MSQEEPSRAARVLGLHPRVFNYRSKRWAALMLVLGCMMALSGSFQILYFRDNWFDLIVAVAGTSTVLLALSDLLVGRLLWTVVTLRVVALAIIFLYCAWLLWLTATLV